MRRYGKKARIRQIEDLERRKLNDGEGRQNG